MKSLRCAWLCITLYTFPLSLTIGVSAGTWFEKLTTTLVEITLLSICRVHKSRKNCVVTQNMQKKYLYCKKYNLINIVVHLSMQDFFILFYEDGWLDDFSCDQAALRTLLSVQPSVCPKFFTLFPSLYHHEIFRSVYQWKKLYPCKWSRSEAKGQGHSGQNTIQ